MRNNVLFSQAIFSAFSYPHILPRNIWGESRIMKEHNSGLNLKLLLETISGRQGFFSHIQPERNIQVRKIVNHIQEIIGKIFVVAPSKTAQNLLPNESHRFDELFVEYQL
jgi:hypothetical protein